MVFSSCCTLPPARSARRSTRMRCWSHFPSCLPGNFLLHSTLNLSHIILLLVKFWWYLLLKVKILTETFKYGTLG
jgi:hypothetical protein